ncbi:hypothetical protein DNTS_011424 [Danionella cerebrum]|uniref:SET domain-containing protein n=1 Tax=Danionella cerebrum TaxID=2873325 RepID=A0A553NRF3_9TELE|nr:hypothetical protein DNTS_011424 [Danionella translucida]
MFEFRYNGRFLCVDVSRNDGSLGRPVNDDHINPNSQMKICVERQPRFCLFATRQKYPGEGITHNYDDSDWPWRLAKMSLVEDRASTMSVNISVPDDERSLVEDRASTMSRSLVEDRASTMSVNFSVPDDERSLVEDRASTMSVNISVPDDERSLVEDRASIMSRSLVEDRASIMSVNISVLMMRIVMSVAIRTCSVEDSLTLMAGRSQLGSTPERERAEQSRAEER